VIIVSVKSCDLGMVRVKGVWKTCPDCGGKGCKSKNANEAEAMKERGK
jgi:hypothetical protein